MASTTTSTGATVLVYRGDALAARFVHGAPPRYHGAAGQRVRALVEGERLRYNPWALEVRESGLYHDSADWFLASVLLGSGLARAGYRVLSRDEPAGSAWDWPA